MEKPVPYELKHEIRNDGVLFTIIEKAWLRSPRVLPPTDWNLSQLDLLATSAGRLLRAADEVEVEERLSNGEPIGKPAAFVTEEGILLTHARVAGLSEHIGMGLGLPPVTPLTLSIRSEDIFSSPKFRLESWWMEQTGANAVGVIRKGAFIRYQGRWQRLSKPLFTLTESIDDFANADPNDQDDCRKRLVKITQALPQETQASVLNDGYLLSLKICHAATFSLRLLTEGGSFQIEPVLFGRQAKSDWDIHEDFETSYSKAETYKFLNPRIPTEAEALLSPARQDKFAKIVLERSPSGCSTFVLGENEYIYVDPLLREALQVVKEIRRADPEIRKEFACRPQAFLKERLGEIFNESRIEDIFIATQEYSDRIAGLSVWNPTSLPSIQKESNPWLPESFGLKVGNKYVVLKSIDDANSAIQTIDAGISAGQSTVTIQGVSVPATQESKLKIEELKPFLLEKPQGGDNSQSSPSSQPQTRIFLDVNENFDKLEYGRFEGPNRPICSQGFIEPRCLKTSLKEHQKEALRWMREDLWSTGYSGCLLADDMGLGKTLSTIAFLAWIKENNEQLQEDVLPSLIVAPTSLMGNWKEEIERHLNAPRLGVVAEIHGSQIRRWRTEESTGTDVLSGASQLDSEKIRQSNLVLTTYETLRDYHHSFAAIPFSVVVFDEMQKAKNPTSQIARAVKVINARFRIGLTGTPIENSLTDLWAIIDALLPGYLPDLSTFNSEFDPTNIENLKRLKDRLEGRGDGAVPVMLRRMKNDTLSGLPKKIEHVRKADMPNIQAQAYADVVAGRQKGQQGDALKYLHGLRMISLHPEHPTNWKDVGEDYIHQSARLTQLFNILDEVKGRDEKVLIFLESLEMQDALAQKIRERYNLTSLPFIINGSITGKKRQDFVRNFQEKPLGFDVMILSPKAGGVGLTLTAANNVIHFSRWWNPAVEDQCSDRVYRIGQSKNVNIYYPLALHPNDSLRNYSFDLVLHALLKRKRDLSKDALIPIIDGNESTVLVDSSTPP